MPAAERGQRVYFEIDPTPYAAGPDSFIGETLRGLGLGNAIPADLGPFPRLNPEFVVRTQPDIVMAVQASVADMPRRPGWSTLRALRDGRTCGFPSATTRSSCDRAAHGRGGRRARRLPGAPSATKAR